MKHKQLRTFHVVAQERSFSRAAERLCLTQPALTVQVRNLEETYAVELFSRTPQGVELTRAGAELYQMTQSLFAVETQIQDQLQSYTEGLTGEFYLGVDNPIALLEPIREFNRQHPEVSLHLSKGNSRSILQDLHEKRIDCAYLTDAAEDSRLGRIELNSNRLLLLLPQTTALSDEPVALQQLATFDLLFREPSSNTQQQLDRLLRNQNLNLTPRIRLHSRELMKEAVAAGLGAGFIMSGEMGDDPRFRTRELLENDIVQQGVFCYRLSDRKRPLIKAFLRFLQ